MALGVCDGAFTFKYILPVPPELRSDHAENCSLEHCFMFACAAAAANNDTDRATDCVNILILKLFLIGCDYVFRALSK